jgi:PAS domain-containing protein
VSRPVGLRAITAPAEPLTRFCGHCGRPPEDAPEAPEAATRICARCKLGLLLDAPASVAPSAAEPFLVVDRTLSVCAVSRRAERLLGVTETEAVDRPLTALLLPADTEAGTARGMAELVLAAVTGADGGSHSAIVRPAGEFGVRFQARIGPCGPAPGALVVLADVGA